ncbi:MAG: DNA polymerase III subunit chi [Casimicrobiaceae bacterium]
MTAIDFYSHVADPLRLAAKLVARAVEQHGSARVLTADAAATAALDRILWQEPQVSFLPHCRLGHPEANETPVLIDDTREHAGPAAVLINLHPEPAPFFSRFERLIEIVGVQEQELATGRARFRFYRERGYAIRNHDRAGRD